jgi:hypothetical protein
MSLKRRVPDDPTIVQRGISGSDTLTEKRGETLTYARELPRIMI